jgi:TRAP-type C4-dicarboxylate transport system permease small subunit
LILALERTATAWARRLALVGGFILVGVSLATVGDSLLRSFLGRPIPGAFEATELVLAVLIFFGLPYTSLVDGHVGVDFVTQRLSARAQHAVVAVNALATAALLGLITVEMIGLAEEFSSTARTTITARIPVVPFLAAVAVAAALSVVAFLIVALGALVRAVRPGLPAPPRTG